MPSATAHHATVPRLTSAARRPPSCWRRPSTSRRTSPGPACSNWYTVRPGDTLSSIAGRLYHNSSAWQGLYWRNHHISAGRTSSPPGRTARPQGTRAHTRAHPSGWRGRRRYRAHYTPRHASPAAQPAAPAGPGHQHRELERQLSGRRVRRVRRGPRIRWQSPGDELQRPLRPVPVQRSRPGWPTAVTPLTSVTPAWPSRTRCSPTRSPRVASRTGRPTTAADPGSRISQTLAATRLARPRPDPRPACPPGCRPAASMCASPFTPLHGEAHIDAAASGAP